jgi:hypothetical protein
LENRDRISRPGREGQEEGGEKDGSERHLQNSTGSCRRGPARVPVSGSQF